VHGRGGVGVISIQTTDRNGLVTGAELVNHDDEIMLITTSGTLVRTRVDEISVMGRNTQGVKLISLGEDEVLSGVERIANIQEDDSEE
jgi:DNA gyrase subunit A